MAVMNVNPTRMELTRLKKQLNTALRGHKLLKDKRDELMRQFLERIRENKVLRERVEQGIREANSHFVLASAVMQKEVMDTALLELLRLAEVEKATQRMAAEIEKTRRRVNALEHVMIPRLQETIRFITMKLEENDRASRTRLMKVKDMMLEKAHHYHV